MILHSQLPCTITSKNSLNNMVKYCAKMRNLAENYISIGYSQPKSTFIFQFIIKPGHLFINLWLYNRIAWKTNNNRMWLNFEKDLDYQTLDVTSCKPQTIFAGTAMSIIFGYGRFRSEAKIIRLLSIITPKQNHLIHINTFQEM